MRATAFPAAILRLLVVAGLIVDAVIHFRLAPTQPPGGSGQLSQVTLFYAEGVVASAAALLLLIVAARWAWLVAFGVAASALGAVLVSRYADIGAIGPIPNMYEPVWYTSKVAATVAELVATVFAAIGLLGPAWLRASWPYHSRRAGAAAPAAPN